MATVTLRTAERETVHPIERFAVRVKARWSDSWRTAPYLVPVSAEDCAAPRVSSARLRWDYGSIKREDRSIFSTFRQMDLRKQFIQILRISAAGRVPLWHGLVPDEVVAIDGSDDVPSGSQEFRAVGLEYLLDRFSITGARVRENGIEQSIERTPVFNLRHTYGQSAAGNRTAVEGDDGVHLFSGDGALWTNRDIAAYLLAMHTPVGTTFRLSGQDAVLDNLVEIHRLEGLTVRQALDHLISRHRGLGWCIRTAGSGNIQVHVFTVLGSALSAGDSVIPANAERFDLRLDDDNAVADAVARIESATQYDKIRVIGGPLKSCFSASFADGTLEAGWTPDEEAAYEAGDLVDNTDADLNDAERRTDKHERVFQMFRLPRQFAWLVGNGEGTWPEPVIANPLLLRDGTLDTATQAPTWNPGKVIERYIPFAKAGSVDGAEPEYQTPLVVAWDPTLQRWVQVESADAAGVENGSCQVRPVDREAAIDVRGQINHVLGLGHFGSVLTSNPEFQYGDSGTGTATGWALSGEMLWSEPGQNIVIDLTSGAGTVTTDPAITATIGQTYTVWFSLTVAGTSAPGAGATVSIGGASGAKILAGGTATYTLAATTMDGLTLAFDAGFEGTLDSFYCLEAPPVSNMDPVFNWQSMIATVMLATDERLRIDAYTSGYSQTSNPQVLTLDVDGAELWYVCPGTVVGVANGALVRSAGSIERDDRGRLRLIAAMACAWYGRYRSAVSVTWRHVARYADVGQYLDEVSDSWQREPVGTPVTTLLYDFDQGTTQLQTGYWELDVQRVIDLFPGMSDPKALGREIRAIRRDVRDLQVRVGNMPTRYTVGAGGGSGTTSLYTLPLAYTGVY